jgi:hypothetical protein
MAFHLVDSQRERTLFLIIVIHVVPNEIIYSESTVVYLAEPLGASSRLNLEEPLPNNKQLILS